MQSEKTRNGILDSDLLVKNGEIAMIRGNLNKLKQENNELKERLARQMMLNQQEQDILRNKLQKEVQRLSTEMTFKV